MRQIDYQKTNLQRYFFYALAATSVIAILPLWVAYRLSSANRLPFYVSIALTMLLSIALSKVGAALWQRHHGSRDVVFDDLMVWGYLRRVWNQRRVRKTVRQLRFHRRETSGTMSRDKQATTLRSLAVALETGDPYTHGHSSRVARHSLMTAKAMKLPQAEREKIRLAASVHDVGKLHIPREILTKPDRLTDEEFTIIKQHPSIGADMVAEVGDPQLTAIVRHHHERMDGTGYPSRLAGTDIPLGARVIAVADTFDAITSLRPYRSASTHKEAIDILTKEAGRQLDGDVVKAFLTYYTGRRSIRIWLLVNGASERFLTFWIGGLQRVVTQAAVVGGTAAVITASSLMPPRIELPVGPGPADDPIVVADGSTPADEPADPVRRVLAAPVSGGDEGSSSPNDGPRQVEGPAGTGEGPSAGPNPDTPGEPGEEPVEPPPSEPPPSEPPPSEPPPSQPPPNKPPAKEKKDRPRNGPPSDGPPGRDAAPGQQKKDIGPKKK